MLTEIVVEPPQWTPESSVAGDAPKLSKKQKAKKLVDDFNEAFGTDPHKLANWQSLCAEVGLKADLPSITQCKKVCISLGAWFRLI